MSETENNHEQHEVQYYLSLVGHKIQVLLRRIETLKRASYPTPHPIALAEIMTRILMRSFDELGRLNDQVGKRENSDIADRAWFIHVFAIRYLSRYIEAIYHADVSTTTGGIIDAFNAICNQAQFGTSLIIYPTWNYNFSFEEVSEKLATIAERISTDEHTSVFEGKYPRHIIITYPHIEEETTLGQVLLAHEVGHFIDFAQGWSIEVEEQPIFSRTISSFPDDFPKEEQTIALRLVQHIGARWIREIIADTIATSILGPAYVLGLGEFTFANPSLRTGSREIVTSHPPEELRLQLMGKFTIEMQLEPVKDLSIYNLLSEQAKKVSRLVAETIISYSEHQFAPIERIQQYSVSPMTAQWVFSQLVTAMHNVVENIKIRSQETLTESWTCSSDDVLQALALHEYLRHGFTPTELPQPFDEIIPSFAAVMNSGWFFMLDQKNEEKYFFFKPDLSNKRRPEVVNEAYISVQQLVAKAIETLNFQRQFRRQKGNSGR